MDVGVRELKQKLSEYLDLAERGELIRVTDRGRPKAILGPLPGQAHVAEGVVAGWITPGSGGPLRAVARVQGLTSVARALGEDRGE